MATVTTLRHVCQNPRESQAASIISTAEAIVDPSQTAVSQSEEGIHVKGLLICGLSVLLLVLGRAPQASADAYRELFDQHRWFDLKAAIQGKHVADLYTGAVAAAFNDVPTAESALNAAVRETTSPLAAVEGREALGLMYVRLGRLRAAAEQFQLILAADPSRSDVANFLGMLKGFNAHPDFAVISNQVARFSCDFDARGAFVPLTVNGRALNWSLDTGATSSALTESEARLIGLRIETGGSVRDMTGHYTTARIAVAETMSLGGAHFRNVPFIVVSDSTPIIGNEPAGRQGAIGPLELVALGSFRSLGGGKCESGWAAVATDDQPNLAFDGLKVVTRVPFGPRALDFVLDSGNRGVTQLWPRFAQEYSGLLQSTGRPELRGLSAAGGSREYSVTALPQLQLAVGKLPITLRPAIVFPRPVGNSIHFGNIGMEVLSQAREVTMDFQSMRLTLR